MSDRAGLSAVAGSQVGNMRIKGDRGGKMRIGPISPKLHAITEADGMIDLIFQDSDTNEIHAFWVRCGEIIYLMLEGLDVSAYPRSEDGYEMDEDDVYDLLSALGTDMRIGIKGSHKLGCNKEFHCRHFLSGEYASRSAEILTPDLGLLHRASA